MFIFSLNLLKTSTNTEGGHDTFQSKTKMENSLIFKTNPICAYCLTLILAFFVITLPTASHSQRTATFFENIGFEQGLSHLSIKTIYRDKRGFLWIGTDGGGLCRFDGQETKVFRHNAADSNSIQADRIASLLEDSSGNLWVGLVNGGISRLNIANGRFQNFTTENGRHFSYFNNFLSQDTTGRIWVASHYHFGYFDAEQQRFVRHIASQSNGYNRSMFDKHNKFWIGGLGGLRCFDPETGALEKFLPRPDVPKRPDINGTYVHLDQTGNIWAGSWGEGLFRFDPQLKQFETFKWKAKTNVPRYNNICFEVAETFDAAQNRSFWIAMEYGLIKMPLAPKDFPNRSTPIEIFSDQTETGIVHCQYICLHTDYEGNLWAGSSGHGVFRYNSRQANFQFVPSDKPVAGFTFSRNGDIVSKTTFGITLYDQKLKQKSTQLQFPAKMKPEGHQPWTVIEGSQEGVFYIGTIDGLLAFDSKKGQTRWYEYRKGDSTGLFSAKSTRLFSLGKDRLLIGFHYGRYQIFDTQTGKNVKILSKSNYTPNQIKRTNDGTIWLCNEAQLAIFDEKKGTIEVLREDGEIDFTDVHCDPKGQIWLATSTGLALFDREKKKYIRKYTTYDGLPDNNIFTIVEDKLGRLWLSTELGICLFEPSRQKFYPLGKSEGFVFGKVNQTMQQSPDGRIWLSWSDKVLVFKPELVPAPQPSRCYITGLKINERDTLPAIFFEKIKEMRLSPGENALTFSFTAIDLATFGKTNFLYKLEGLQTDWVKADKNRMATFVNLPAGRYVFRVRPTDAGDDPTWDASLAVVVTDYFWQRTWFNYLLVLAALLAICGVSAYYFQSKIWLRNAELNRVRAVEQTRLQIAQDIHDDLGSDLSKISMSAALAALIPDLSSEELREKMSSLSMDAEQAAKHLKDVIFIANPRFDAFSEVQAFFREQANLFFENHNEIELVLDCPFFTEGMPDPTVSPEIKRHLYLIFKEILNNIAKHTQATQVEVGFRLVENHFFELKITDNGQGFDPNSTRRFGMGLTGLHNRAEKIGAKLEIVSEIGRGTRILLRGKV